MKFPKISRSFLEKIQSVETPAIIYNNDFLRYSLAMLKKDTEHISELELCFSLKANRNSTVLNVIKEYGFNADVASMTELQVAKNIGFEKIYSTSPSFGKKEVRKIYESGFLFDFDSFSQLINCQDEIIDKRIGLRIKIPISDTDDLTVGWNSRFGLDALDAQLIDYIREEKIFVEHLHIHIGEKKNIKNTSEIIEYIKKVITNPIYEELRVINLGGGYTYLYKDLDEVEKFWTAINDFSIYINKKFNRKIKIVVEPGMLVTFLSGFLLTSVKSSDLNDETINVNLDASAFNLFSWNTPKLIFCNTNDSEIWSHNIFGNTCFEKDIFALNHYENRINVNDKILFHPVGSYVSSMAKSLHGIPTPNEYIFENEEITPNVYS